jgi:uncharacterized protein YqeY
VAVSFPGVAERNVTMPPDGKTDFTNEHDSAMTLAERIDADLKAAMRSRDTIRVRTFRLLSAAVRDVTDFGRYPMTPAGELRLVQREIRMREGAIVAYRNSGRNDLADATAEELEIIRTYLPELMSDDEIRAGVRAIIAESGATGLSDLSIVRQRTEAAIGARADMGRMSAIVLEELNVKERER